jgi:hypothetical protein
VLAAACGKLRILSIIFMVNILHGLLGGLLAASELAGNIMTGTSFDCARE